MSKNLSDLTDQELQAEIERRQNEKLAAEQKTEAQKLAKRREAYVQIEIHIREAYAALEKAQKLANEYDCSFSFHPAYGMGGTYEPGSGWASSSENC